MIRQHHRLHGHELKLTLGDSEGQGSLECSSPGGHKESDTTQQLNNNKEFKIAKFWTHDITNNLFLSVFRNIFGNVNTKANP